MAVGFNSPDSFVPTASGIRTISRHPSSTRLSVAPPLSQRLTPLPAVPAGSVLIIDDDALVRRSVTRGLRRVYAVTEVGSAEEALALLAAGAVFDAILCDLNLDGISGDKLVLTLAAQSNDHVERIVILSGSPRDTIDDNVLEWIESRFLEKPASLGAISDMIAALVSAHARAA